MLPDRRCARRAPLASGMAPRDPGDRLGARGRRASLAVTRPSLATSRSSPTPATRIDYEGTLLFEGDYRRPGQLHVFHSRQTYLTDGHDRARLDWTTWQDGDTLLLPETYLMVGDSVFHRDAPGRPWRRFAGRARQQARVIGVRRAACAAAARCARTGRLAGRDARRRWTARALYAAPGRTRVSATCGTP